MGSTQGTYTRPPQNAPLFSEENRFVQVLLQAGKLVVDADWNDFQNSFYLGLRRVIQNTVGDGAVGDAFKTKEISPSPEPNNFRLLGDYDPNGGPEMFFLSGHPAKLFSDETYIAGLEVSARSTDISLDGCKMTDSAAFWIPDEFVGRYLIPDINQPSFKYEILSNTQNIISISSSSNMNTDGILVGSHYRIELEAPTVEKVRQDLVYLDVYLDEYDKNDDSEIGHSFTGPAIEAARRYKLIQNVFVRQGTLLSDTYTFNGTTTVTVSSTPTDLYQGEKIQLVSDGQYFEVLSILGTTLTIDNPSGLTIPVGTGQASKAGSLPEVYKNGSGEWIDVDGNQHWLIPIATIDREKLNPFITDAMITDLRRIIFTLDEIEDRFVNVTGDTMTGNLTFDAGAMILGDLVLGYDQLKDQSVGTRHFKHDEHLLGDDNLPPPANNLPLVHDNRYYRKSVISLFFGENKLVNPDFSKGLDIGWDNNSPLPIWGGPAESVMENAQIRWMICGPGKCCHGLETQLSSEYYGCEIHAACQEVDVCGGGLYVFQQCFETYAPVNLPQGIKIRPFIDVLMFSSCFSLGKERFTFGREVLIDGVPTIIDDTFEPNSGLKTIRSLFSLPKATDRIIIIVGYETIFEKTSHPCDSLGQPMSLITCKTALRKFADEGTILNNEFVVPEEGIGNPFANESVDDAGSSATIASCESKKVITPECVDNNGKITFTPGWKQKSLMVYNTHENQGDSAFVWGKDTNQSICPEIVETICLDVCNDLKTAVGVGSTALRCFSLNPSTLESPLTGSTTLTVNFTGVNFPTVPGELLIYEAPTAPYGANIVISNIVVNPGGTTGSFDVEIFSTATVGNFVVRFEDINTSETDDCVMPVNKETAPVPCIYDIDCDVIPATNGLPYSCIIYGTNFEPGATTVLSNNPSVATSIVSVAPTQITVDLIPNFPTPTDFYDAVTLTVTTTSGSDQVIVFVGDPAEEYDTAFTEGFRNKTPSGSDIGLTDVVFKFVDGNKPRLIIRGPNMDRYDKFYPVYAHTMPRGSDTIQLHSWLSTGNLNNRGKLVPMPFEVDMTSDSSILVQHEEAIEINMNPYIRPDIGYMIWGFRLYSTNAFGPDIESKIYTLGLENPMSITDARYVSNTTGTGINIEGLFLGPAAFAKVNATLLGVGPRIMYVPVDTTEETCASIQTKLPIDTTQPCNVSLLCPPYGLNNAELVGYNVTLTGPGTSPNSASNSIACLQEPNAPVVSRAFPSVINQGLTLVVEFKGIGFQPGANVVLSPSTGVTVNSINVASDGTAIRAEIEFSGSVPLGGMDVTVTNPDLLNSTLVNAIEIIPPESAVPVLIDSGVGDGESGPDSMKVILNPAVDGVTDVQGQPPLLSGGPFDLRAFRDNNGSLLFRFMWDGANNFNIKFYFMDEDNIRSFYDFGDANAYPVSTWVQLQALISDFQTTAIDYSRIRYIGFVLTPNAGGGIVECNFDTIKVETVVPAASTIFDDFDAAVYPNQATFSSYWFDAGANHVIDLGMPLSRQITPVITNCDEVQNFAFFKDDGWETADVVLYPANENNIENPSAEWDIYPEGTDVSLNYLSYSPSSIPERACRNIMAETMYWTYSGCRSVEAEEREYDVEDPQCGCVPPGGYVQVISQMVTDPLMYRIIPDDGFLNMPSDYGEAIKFKMRYTNASAECETLSLGSKTTPNQVYWAGGKRNDPNLPGGAPTHPITGKPIYIVVHAGPGSPQGSRENLIAAVSSIPAGSTSATIQLSPSPASVPEQIAVGMDVWIMNFKDPRNNGQLCLTACDVLSNKDNLNIYGIYGTVTNYIQTTGIITIEWDDPTPSAALFQPLWGGRVLASPKDRMGFYWEASEGLLDYIDGANDVVMDWEFKLWAGHAADCPNGLYSGLKECTDINASVLLADGNGVDRKYKFSGSTGNILLEREWFDLFSTPTREQCLQADALPGSNTISVIDATRFSVGDMVEVYDSTYTPGFRTSVAQINVGLNQLILRETIPASSPWHTAVFDGYLQSRTAKVFRLVNRVNSQVSPTELQNLDGSPQNLTNQEMAVVNFTAGTITFDPAFEANIRIWSGFMQQCYQLPMVNGVYSFKSVNAWSAISEWSQTVAVRNQIDGTGSGIDPNHFIATDGTNGPIANIPWNNFQITNLADGTAGHHAVNLNQVTNLISAASEIDPFSIHTDNSQGPSVDISWNNNRITNLAAAVAASDAVRFDQLPTNLSRFEIGTYTGTNAGFGGSRVINLTDPTLTPSFIIVYHSNISFPNHSTLALKIGSSVSIYTLEAGSSEPYIAESSIISALGLGTFTVGNSSVSVVGADVSGDEYSYIVIGS